MTTLLASLLGGPCAADEGPTLQELPEFAALKVRFEKRLPTQLARMQACMEDGLWDELAAIAHSIKGSAGTFGHPGEGLVAARIEAAVRDGETQRVGQLLAGLRKDVRSGSWA